MGGFWDILEGDQLRGKCETNFFHMYVYRDIDTSNISKLDSTTKGTFMHEYLHYIQFINTIFGISYGTTYNNYFSLCRDYFATSKTINIPLNIQAKSPELKKLIEKYRQLKGNINASIDEIQRIEIDPKQIQIAKKQNSGVLVTAYENLTGTKEQFNFGYLCIIKSMAHIFQSFFDENAEHKLIPYKAVQLICKDYIPYFANDKRMMFSICLCSLMYNNPAYGFFEILIIVKQNPRLNGQLLYKHMLEESNVCHNGVNKSIKDLFLELIDDYQNNIQSAIGNELTYFSKVFENCRLEINKGESILLKLLYEYDITSKESIDFLLDFYGLPLIDSNTQTLMAKLPLKGSTFIDIARLRGLELVINRFSPRINSGKHPIYDPKCPMYDKCLKSLYASDKPLFDMTKDCENKQWQKKEKCLMTESLKYYKIYGKQILQNELPIDMQ